MLPSWSRAMSVRSTEATALLSSRAPVFSYSVDVPGRMVSRSTSGTQLASMPKMLLLVRMGARVEEKKVARLETGVGLASAYADVR